MSRDLSAAMKIAGSGLAAAGALAAGAIAGAAIERLLVSKPLRDFERHDFVAKPDRTVTVTAADGTELHVEIDDGPDDVTVVLVHGYALTLDSWYFQREALRGAVRVVSYDQRSHGSSGRAEFDTHHVDQLGYDLATVIDTVAPTGDIILVGHSMGGMTVLALADQHPEWFGTRIKGVVLLATTSGDLAEFTLGLPEMIGQQLARFAPAIVSTIGKRSGLVKWSLDTGGTSDLGLLLTKVYSFGSNVSPDLTHFVASMVSGTSADVLTEFLPALQDHNKADALANLAHVDLTVVVGERDRLTPPAHSEFIAAHVPNVRLLVLPDTGHMLILERPSEVNLVIGDMVAQVRAERAA